MLIFMFCISNFSVLEPLRPWHVLRLCTPMPLRFTALFPSLATPSSARVLFPPLRNVMKASTSETMLVDKSQSEKTHRFKTAYLERIIRVLKDEFKYVNIHQSLLLFFTISSASTPAQVTSEPKNTRDSFHRRSIDFVLNAYKRAPWESTSVEICSEDAREFIAGLAENIGLGKIDAARMVSVAVAARTCSWFLQA